MPNVPRPLVRLRSTLFTHVCCGLLSRLLSCVMAALERLAYRQSNFHNPWMQVAKLEPFVAFSRQMQIGDIQRRYSGRIRGAIT
jgi:hypothetical protein